MPIYKIFEAEIRDKNSHASNSAKEENGITVIDSEFESNELHNGRMNFQANSNLRIYFTNTHDQSFDIQVQQTGLESDDFAHTDTHSTLTLGSGDAFKTLTMQCPVGRVRFVTQSLSKAPTKGKLTAEILAND